MERRLLQLTLAAASLVPLSAGLAMMTYGPGFLDLAASVSADSHFRYLSGLLFGIGCVVLTIIPNIERNGETLRAIASIVALGGFARLWSLIHVGWPGTPMALALFMELGVTPALYFWQRRIARAAPSHPDR